MIDDKHTPRGVGRRQFLQATVASALVGMATRWPIFPPALRRLDAPSRAMSPDSAIQQLLDGNRRYVANRLTAENDLGALRKQTAEKQQPFAGVLACADSRVPVELVFDQSIGQIFTTRVAGNIVTPEIIASLEYAVAALGIQAILVLGHTNCGAVKAAMKAESEPGQISALYPHLRPAVAASGGDVAKAIAANARMQAELLRTSSTVVRDATKAGTLAVVAGVYDLATGQVALAS
jgi:carbonic anhydrase